LLPDVLKSFFQVTGRTSGGETRTARGCQAKDIRT
jgi:hypothetical protein